MPTPSAGTVWLPSKATPTSSDRHANHHFEAAGVGADAIDALRRRLSYSSAMRLDNSSRKVLLSRSSSPDLRRTT